MGTWAPGVQSLVAMRAVGPGGDARGGLHAAADPASPPIIVTGRTHHAARQLVGSVPTRLLHQSPYPVLTIT